MIITLQKVRKHRKTTNI